MGITPVGIKSTCVNLGPRDFVGTIKLMTAPDTCRIFGFGIQNHGPGGKVIVLENDLPIFEVLEAQLARLAFVGPEQSLTFDGLTVQQTRLMYLVLLGVRQALGDEPYHLRDTPLACGDIHGIRFNEYTPQG